MRFGPNEMAWITGLTTTVGGLGALMATTPFAWMANALSWRLSFVLIGLVSILLAAVIWRVVRNRPADCGLPTPSGEETGKGDGLGKGTPTLSIWQGLKVVLRNPYTWPPFLGFFAFYSTLMGFSGLWGIPFLTQVYGLSKQAAANYMMVLQLGLILGCPITGWFSDRVLTRRRLPFVLCLTFYALTWGLLCFLGGGRPSLQSMYLICFSMGFFSTGFILIMVCSKEVNPLNVAGIAMGTANMGGFLGGAIFQILLGKILDLKWNQAMVEGVRIYSLEAYRTAFLVCFATTVLGIVAGFFVKETKCRNLYGSGLNF